jgi:RNA polymerase sigma-70 factor (ECF subfamily)
VFIVPHATPADGFFAAWLGNPSAARRAEFEVRLEEIRRALLAAWPEGPPRGGSFWAELARCIPDDIDEAAALTALAGVHAVDLHLTFCCRHGDTQALGRFERDHLAAQAAAVSRIDASGAFVDEVLQRVRMKLLVAEPGEPAKLAHYTGKGPLRTWLRVVAIREALNLRASRSHDGEVADDALLRLDGGRTDPELGLLKDEYRAEFREALVDALAVLDAAERNLLRLHYLHGLTLEELGRLLDVHRSSVARRIAKVRETVLSATRRALLTRLAIGRAEFGDLVAMLESRWDLSIERALGVSIEP